MGLPVSGLSLAFRRASWNFFSSRSEACFCASTDCRKMASRRLSCSFMARAASSMSLKVLGLTAAVWAMTALVAGSTFSTALQQGWNFGQLAERYPQPLVRRQAYGQDLEQIQHLPGQQEHRDDDRHDGQQFPETHAVVARLDELDHPAENVQGGEPEHHDPQDVIDVAFLLGGCETHDRAQESPGRPARIASQHRRDRTRTCEMIDEGQQQQTIAFSVRPTTG